MASSSTIIEDKKLKYPCKQDVFQKWQENGSKIKFGEHQLNFDLDGIDEFFSQKAKEELRETPEIIADSYNELRKLIAGNARSIV